MIQTTSRRLRSFADTVDRAIRYVGINRLVVAWVSLAIISSVGLYYIRLLGLIPPGADTWRFVNAFYNTVNGNGFFSLLPHQYTISEVHNWNDYNHFGIHAEPTLLLLVPVYAIFPSVFTILIIQAIALGTATIPLHKFVKETVDASSANILALAYLLYPSTILNVRNFYPITFLPLFVFLLLYAYKKQRMLLYSLSLLLALGLKETTPFILAPLGLVLLYDQYITQRLGQRTPHRTLTAILTIVISVAWFFIALLVFIPAFSSPGSSDDLTSRYAYLGNSLSEIIINTITNPVTVITKLFRLHTFWYILTTVFPLAGAPLRTPISLILCFPIFLQNALSTKHLQHTFYYHYQFMFLVGLIVSIIYILKKFDIERRKEWLGTIALTTISSVMIYIGYFIWLVSTGKHI